MYATIVELCDTFMNSAAELLLSYGKVKSKVEVIQDKYKKTERKSAHQYLKGCKPDS